MHYFIQKTFRGKYFLSSVSASCNTDITVCLSLLDFFSKNHSNKQKLLRRCTTRKHRYTAFMLPCYMTSFLWECWLIPGAWVSVGGCSLRWGSVIKTGRGTSVAFIVIYYLPLFDLCLSNALLLLVVILFLTMSALRMVVRFHFQ